MRRSGLTTAVLVRVRIVISRSEFSLRCNVRLLFVCSPERGLYIRDREYPCLNKTTFRFYGFLAIKCVHWLIDWIDSSLRESDPTSPNPRLWVCIEYAHLLFMPLKLVSSVYSLFKPSGKSVACWDISKGRYFILMNALKLLCDHYGSMLSDYMTDTCAVFQGNK